MFVSEIYAIEDLLLYRSSVSNSDTFDVTLPNKFEITSNVTKTSSTYAYVYYQIYNDSTLIYEIGALREKGSLSIRKNGDTLVADNNSSIIQLNSQTELKYTYDNGSQTLSANNTTITGTDSTTINKFKSVHIEQYTVTELKIKPL